MTTDNIVKIHGKDYMTVAGRVQLAHEQLKKLTITTEVLPIPDMVVVRATVTTDKGVFTGISAANPSKQIERQSPYEVAETSAVGRALGFAGYGAVESIASADEMVKASHTQSKTNDKAQNKPIEGDTCRECGTTLPPHRVEASLAKFNKIICYTCEQKGLTT